METAQFRRRYRELLTAYWQTQTVHVTAKLQIADLLAAGPLSIDELAARTGTHLRSLYRLLRAAASLGIVVEGPADQFALTDFGQLLRQDVPDSQWGQAVLQGEEHYACWGDLLTCVRTGEYAFPRLYGQHLFEFLEAHPEKSKIFDAAMTGINHWEGEAVAQAYNFSSVETIVDVGGGNGSNLAMLLRRFPRLRGTLFDRPNVVEAAKTSLRAGDLEGRLELVGGSFFDEVPAGADLYHLRHIIHDWDDEKSVAILATIRRAMKSTSRILLVETVIPPGNDECLGKLLDLTMMVYTSGIERTEAEYRGLFESAGLEFTEIREAAEEVHIIEGKVA